MNNSILSISNYEVGSVIRKYNSERKIISYMADIKSEEERIFDPNKSKIDKDMMGTEEVNINMEEGDYLTIVFDDNWENTWKYYKKILNYISDKNITTIGDFNEVWVMPRINYDGSIIILGYIEILCKIK